MYICHECREGEKGGAGEARIMVGIDHEYVNVLGRRLQPTRNPTLARGHILVLLLRLFLRAIEREGFPLVSQLHRPGEVSLLSRTILLFDTRRGCRLCEP